jgi:general secretion pathway protein A
VYEAFYGFAENPFSLTPDPKFFYHGESHIRAFELLRYSVSRGEGFIVVYGEVGMGKTMLCRAVLENVQQNTYTALLLNPFLNEADLLRAILQDFGVLSPGARPAQGRMASKHDLITTLNRFLLSILGVNGRAVVVIDEAQNLPIATLEQIRILSNLETDKHKLLQIVLVGQTELKEVLAKRELRQLNQRISTRCELLPLSREETSEYIRHRLTLASSGKLTTTFTPDAAKVIYRYSRGTPRLINLIGDRCLMAGLASNTRTISRKQALEAVRNLELRKPRSFGKVRTDREGLSLTAWVLIVIAAAASASFLIWGLSTNAFTRWLNLP